MAGGLPQLSAHLHSGILAQRRTDTRSPHSSELLPLCHANHAHGRHIIVYFVHCKQAMFQATLCFHVQRTRSLTDTLVAHCPLVRWNQRPRKNQIVESVMQSHHSNALARCGNCCFTVAVCALAHHTCPLTRTLAQAELWISGCPCSR